MSIHKMTRVDGLHPKDWPIEHVADVGYNEPFVWNIMEIATPVDASTLGEQQRKHVKHGLATIVTDGLVPALLDLRQIRQNDGRKMPTINREEPYGNMARKLWKAYKPLMSGTARMMGFQIGFLYDNDKKFAAGLAEFRKDNPGLRPGFEEFLESGRIMWQQGLADFRNKWLEHPVGNRKQFDKFYTRAYAEQLFKHVWTAIADILPLLLEVRLIHGTRLLEQPADDPAPRWAQRFRYDVPMFRNENQSSS